MDSRLVQGKAAGFVDTGVYSEWILGAILNSSQLRTSSPSISFYRLPEPQVSEQTKALVPPVSA